MGGNGGPLDERFVGGFFPSTPAAELPLDPDVVLLNERQREHHPGAAPVRIASSLRRFPRENVGGWSGRKSLEGVVMVVQCQAALFHVFLTTHSSAALPRCL